MNPTVALAIWFVLLVLLFRYDPAKDDRSSWALMVPLVWMIILSSKLPSLWLGISPQAASQAMEEGNWLDRLVFVSLIVLAIAILASRALQWEDFLSRNRALVLYLAFAFLSFAWSDFPLVTLKRWIRDLGMYLMVLVVVTDPRPLDAIATIIRRVSYLVVPLSVILVKYYPHIGVGYDVWSGAANYKGVTYNKNSLGALCLVSGIFFFWDTVRRWHERRDSRTRRILLVNAAFFVMTLWLLKLCQSATSQLCLTIGCSIIAIAHSGFARRRPWVLKLAVPAAAGLYLVLESLFDFTELVAISMGRTPTLTGRTDVWTATMALTPNPWLGTGYESFWLGPRLQALWDLFHWQPTQAHSGYVEIYLNLGLLGLVALGLVLLGAYLDIWRASIPLPHRSLALGCWSVLVLYNVTEAAFKHHRLWFLFLLVAVVAPQPAVDTVPLPRSRVRPREALTG